MASNSWKENIDADQDEYDYEDFSLPRNAEITGYIDYETTQKATMETHIPETNIGYKLLQRMGWKAGQGLGIGGQGRVDPIPIELKDDVVGVGKAQEEATYHVSSTAKRKALGSEKQLEESIEERAERTRKVEKQQMIAQELKEVKRAFYCELCDKQYNKVAEYEQHLQSYDHHHKKRFKDMKERSRKSDFAMSAKGKTREKERKREERELKRIQDAILQRTSGVAPQSNQASTTSITRSTGVSGGGGGWVSMGAHVTTPAPLPTNTGDRTSISVEPRAKSPAATTTPSQSADANKASPASNTTTTGLKREPQKFSLGAPKKATSFRFGLRKKE